MHESHYYDCAHEIVFTWANNSDGTVDRERLTKVVESQLKAHYQAGIRDGRKEAISELKESMADIFAGPHLRCSNCYGTGGGCTICKDKGYVQHGLK
jgi:hypothetical protein